MKDGFLLSRLEEEKEKTISVNLIIQLKSLFNLSIIYLINMNSYLKNYFIICFYFY